MPKRDGRPGGWWSAAAIAAVLAGLPGAAGAQAAAAGRKTDAPPKRVTPGPVVRRDGVLDLTAPSYDLTAAKSLDAAIAEARKARPRSASAAASRRAARTTARRTDGGKPQATGYGPAAPGWQPFRMPSFGRSGFGLTGIPGIGGMGSMIPHPALSSVRSMMPNIPRVGR